MRKIRNHIVHEEGRINPLSYNNNEDFRETVKSIETLALEPSDNIIVSEEYCKHALEVVEAFVNCISQFNTKY